MSSCEFGHTCSCIIHALVMYSCNANLCLCMYNVCVHFCKVSDSHLIICGTETLLFSSKAFIIRPLQRMLSMHWKASRQSGATALCERNKAGGWVSSQTCGSFFYHERPQEFFWSYECNSIEEVPDICRLTTNTLNSNIYWNHKNNRHSKRKISI